MLRVKNRRAIRSLARGSFFANRTRNFVAVLAILLTTMLFCTLFTTALSLNASVEQDSMRQAEGDAHANFKSLTLEEVDALKDHPLIREYGVNQILSILKEGVFRKDYAEVRYSDETYARMTFCEPETGRMPEADTELATDTQVLELLGVPARLGERVTLDFPYEGGTIEKTFTLCGFWERDGAAPVSEIWVSEGFVSEFLSEYPPDEEMQTYQAGVYELNLYFDSSAGAEEKLRTIAEDCGYQIDEPAADNYLNTGINWAYTTSHFSDGDLLINLLTVGCVALVILLAGYLIIYNVFQISVAGDVRFYGLLKTIGATGRQLRRIIRLQALYLCLPGIPLGLLAGYLAGGQITRLIVGQMDIYGAGVFLNPWIFILSAAFSLFTVLLSVHKPGRVAARVSPVEAVRYVEAIRGRGGRKKVIVTASMALSVILLYITCTIASGFDMNRYVEKFRTADFLVAHADYFQNRYGSNEQALSDAVMAPILSQEGIEESGCVWLDSTVIQLPVGKERYLNTYSDSTRLLIEDTMTEEQKALPADGQLDVSFDFYGFDELPFSMLEIVEGSLTWEEFQQEGAVIQLVPKGDYGNAMTEMAPFEVGDTVTVTVADEYTVEEPLEGTEEVPKVVIQKSRTKEFRIAATAALPDNLGTRRWGGVMLGASSDSLRETLGENCGVMSLLLNVEDSQEQAFGEFLEQYTENAAADYSFESREDFSAQFESLRQMFLVVGGSLSLIVGLVGALNFTNAVITDIRSRKKELAMLRSIGMTGKQLCRMLIRESLLYGLLASGAALIVNLLLYLLVMGRLESLLWFFRARWYWYPSLGMLAAFMALGVCVPLLVYAGLRRQTLVEQLRELE